MKKLIDAVEKRLQEINDPDLVEENMRTFTVRLPIEVIEKLDDLTYPLQMKRTEVARMILLNGVEEIFQHLDLKVEKHGISFEDKYALENGEKTLDEILKAGESE